MDKLIFNDKDSIFKQIFSIPEYFVDLYKACSGKTISPQDITPFSLNAEHIRRPLTNDVSCLTKDNQLIIIVEHQSTPNPNMPQRELLYYASLLHNWLTQNDINLSQMGKINVPLPEFYVAYNGKRSYNQATMAFGNEFIHIKVKLLEMKQEKLHDHSKDNALTGYVFLYDQFHAKIAEGLSREEAFVYATDKCLEEGYLKNIVNKEAFRMTGPLLLTREEDLKWQGYYEGQLDGIEQGIEQEKNQTAQRLLHRGMAMQDVADITGLSLEVLREL